jgi:catechol 2,3-dioxygenase-like lactoylglutathione lyase family enzyme
MTMSDIHFVLLAVASPETSAAFYAQLLGREAVEASPTFAMFVMTNGLKLGLWARHTMEPTVTAAPGASELAVAVEDKAAVLSMHEAWKGQGIGIAQAPIDMDFGYTFTALDPDGHRLRVFAPGAA